MIILCRPSWFQDLKQSNQGNPSQIQCPNCANLKKCEIKNCGVIKLSKLAMNAHYCSKAHFYNKIIAKEKLLDIPYPFKCPKGCQDTFKKKYDLVRHMGVRHGLIQYFLQKETKGNGPELQPSTSNSNASIRDTTSNDDNWIDFRMLVKKWRKLKACLVPC